MMKSNFSQKNYKGPVYQWKHSFQSQSQTQMALSVFSQKSRMENTLYLSSMILREED
jgi:hypothetical protein